jgi:hypothetical protein
MPALGQTRPRADVAPTPSHGAGGVVEEFCVDSARFLGDLGDGRTAIFELAFQTRNEPIKLLMVIAR